MKKIVPFILFLILTTLTTSVVSAKNKNAGSRRIKPAKNVTLNTKLVGITFDRKDGLPVKYELPALKESFKGKEKGQTIKISVKKAFDKNRSGISLARKDTLIIPRLKKIDISGNQADVHYEGYSGGLKIVAFTIRYAVNDLAVSVTMENVSEQNGYELVEINIGSLVTISQSDGPAWFAHGDGGGYYADLAVAKPSVLNVKKEIDFPCFPNFSYLPLVMMGNGKINSSMEVQGYISNTQLEISESNGQKSATMGVKSYYRVESELTSSLLVGQKELCRIDFTGDYDNNKKTDWLDAAKEVRDRMPVIPTHYFDNRLVWIISGQTGRAKNVTITFPDIEKVIKKISMLTDGVPQAVYVSGWTEGGHDTGYPNVSKLNEKMGGLQGYNQLKEKAAPYDANISFDDNYDDQYVNEFSKGVYDEKYISRNEDGSLMKQRAWNGMDTSYITGMAKYMKDGGPGMERINLTCQKYDLKHSELIDALSWWSIRNDWDTSNPASAVINLRDGKFKLIDEFKKRGVSIISELQRYPFVGKLALTVDGPQGDGWNDFEGTQIPLQHLVYSKSMIYGQNGGDGIARDPRITLFENCRRGPWIGENTASTEITNYYFLNFLPWTKLHTLDILAFQRNGQNVEMSLSKNSSVKIDYSKDESFSAVYNGAKIMDGNSITCPIDNNRIAFYSKKQQTLSYPIPEGIYGKKLKAKALFEDRTENVPFEIVNGNIVITVQACRPVIIYY